MSFFGYRKGDPAFTSVGVESVYVGWSVWRMRFWVFAETVGFGPPCKLHWSTL
jgi:hypothetical protein